MMLAAERNKTKVVVHLSTLTVPCRMGTIQLEPDVKSHVVITVAF